MTTELNTSTIAILKDYVLTNNGTNLAQNMERLRIFDEKNGIIQKIGLLLSEINQWNIEAVQSFDDQLTKEIEDAPLQVMLKIFIKHLILSLFDQIIERIEQIEIRIEILLRKNQVLEDILPLTKELQDQILINKYFEMYLDNLIILGLYALYSTNYKSVFQFLGQALELQKEKTSFPAKHAFILRVLACLILKLRKNPAILKLARESMKIIDDTQHYQICLKYLKRAIALDKAANNTPGLALDHYNLAMLYYEQSLLDQALDEVKKAQNLHEKLDERECIINDIILTGLTKMKRGETDEAYEIYSQALNIAISLDLKYKIGELNLLIGNYLRAHQKADEGLKYLKTALLIFKQENEGSESDFIEVYNGIGAALRSLHKTEDSKGFFLKIMTIEQKTDSQALLMELYVQLALTFIEMDDKYGFQESCDKISSIYRVTKDDPQYATCEYNLGLSFFQKEQFPEGLEHLYKAFQIFYNTHDLVLIEQTMHTLYFVYSKLNKFDLAQTLSDKSMDLMARSQIVFEQIPPEIPPPPSPPSITPMPKFLHLIKEAEEGVTEKSTETAPSISISPPTLERICFQCGFTITDTDFNYCPKCAAKLDTIKTCKNCGFLIESSEFNFCPKCSHPLD